MFSQNKLTALLSAKILQKIITKLNRSYKIWLYAIYNQNLPTQICYNNNNFTIVIPSIVSTVLFVRLPEKKKKDKI